MTGARYILDNQDGTVADFLRRRLAEARTFDLVSAYFSIYGYELLADRLDGLDRVRFLFGDPSSVDDLDPVEQPTKRFVIAENGLVPGHTLYQKFLARRCAEWAADGRVSIRSISRANFLHGKLYLTESAEGDAAGVAGSSNFTRRGLGGGELSNLEINLAVTDPDALDELRGWFDRLWGDEERTHDVKQQVLDALNRLGSDYAPESVYYKTLYEMFKRELEEWEEGDGARAYTGLYDSQIWNALYEFQKDGAKSIIYRLGNYDGCILADSVGLGKTYTALAVIKYFESRNQRVLVLCPRKLASNWSLYQAHKGHVQNPFPDDRFGYTLLAHTDLSRDRGMSDGINLAAFNWGNYDLVVIDESHNFRNSDGKRYQRLLEDIIAAGVKTKVLMLSATPVNVSLTDLRNQIYLMTEKQDDSLRELLGVDSIYSLMAVAQREFKQWEVANKFSTGPRDKTKLLEKLGSYFFRLLGALSIARSRNQIELFYAMEMDRVGRFPDKERPDNRYPHTDLRGELSYHNLVKRIEKFSLAVYRPSDYLIDEERKRELEKEKEARNFNQQDREKFLIGMMRTNFLKRLESSAHSLTLTLNRTIVKINDLLDKIERYRGGGLLSDGHLVEVLPEDDEDDEDLYVNQAKRPYRLSELDLPRWQADLRTDAEALAAAKEKVAAITPERDGKLAEIKQALRDRAQSPTIDRDGRASRKMLVFTTFKDTALYLHRELEGLASELGLNIALVTGDETRASIGGNDYNAILTNFAPVARNRSLGTGGAGEVDLLIATDCISEGQNLQDCDMVVNYDIHWNPVRIIQRFGRIDRIGSRYTTIRMLNFWPTEDMDLYLNLENRVYARMALADATAGGDEDPLDEEEIEEGVQMELNFRYGQLLKVKDEALNMDDLDDSPAISDFTFDYFFAQLLRYLDENREALEDMPPGVYAVAEARGESVRPGVIFLLRLRSAVSDLRQQTASPVHPFYTVYIQDDRTIRFGCGNTHQVLRVFEEAAVGRDRVLTDLCDQFDRRTQHGQVMDLYDRLLRDTIAHIRQAHAGKQTAGLRSGGRGFVLSAASEAPAAAGDFELVTWLVIGPPDENSTA